ncbi:SAM-dependent methyltransferase [Legionella spiritensis]|uniref:SAM-dependent methyltransferase n=1 Tax=Legionella spiritensis TaxID=452 RepID=UPI000F6F0DC9|nr:SAM-dependent methyltransferase [Legionella spiritensis]VEG91779.1 uroporphyrinogen III methylase [Legionella spiritensis]
MSVPNKLVLVGSGIKTLAHLTREAQTYIEKADFVLYLLNEPVLEQYVQKLNPNHESLEPIYFKHPKRSDAYMEITNHILAKASEYPFLTIVLYGHPTVFASPGLAALRKARASGYETLILPGISAEDCLFADLEIDPGSEGCISIEATEFLLKERTLDPYSHVLLWQIAMLGNLTHAADNQSIEALNTLSSKLLNYYSPQHELFIYEAAIYPGMNPRIDKLRLENLIIGKFTTLSTLYIPPRAKAPIDHKVLEELNLQ